MTTLRYEVVAIFGPTASGKSAVARRLADELDTDVVSADALQVYRGLAILTNQPYEPTVLVGIRNLSDSMSVGEYAGLAHESIDDLVWRHGAAVVAGGTGPLSPCRSRRSRDPAGRRRVRTGARRGAVRRRP